MKYIRLIWVHNFNDSPVILYYEYDDEDADTVVRKIEVFPDGRVGLASKEVEYGGSFFPEVVSMGLDEFLEDKDMRYFFIQKEYFERIWNKYISTFE